MDKSGIGLIPKFLGVHGCASVGAISVFVDMAQL